MEHTAVSPLEWYEEHVLPAVVERLDTVFPELGFRRDAKGWIATDDEATHRLLAVRAERVVCHGHAPAGFLIHGAEPVLFTTYINNGARPRGAEFVESVRELARRAGLDTTPIDTPRRPDRRAQLLETFHTLCVDELNGERGAPAREYLRARGVTLAGPGGEGLGVAPPLKEALRGLLAHGFSRQEIENAGILVDRRWPGRLTGAWKDTRGSIGTLWARTLDTTSSHRYLYLRGARRTGLPPYGLDEARAARPGKLEELVLVEGVLDVHQLRTHAITNIAALGSTHARGELFEHLDRLGIQRVLLALDNDQPGRTATARAIDNACRATRAPEIRVLPPENLGTHKDPGEYTHAHGAPALRALLTQTEDAISWRTRELLGPETDLHTETARRAALHRAGHWLGTLPPRLALEQEDATKLAAHTTGYDPATVTRAFQARYWQPDTTTRSTATVALGR